MPKITMEQQAKAQAIYMEALTTKAKDIAKKNLKEMAFDPQERLLIDVSLEPMEIAKILEKLNINVDPKLSLEEALGRKPTPITTISVDISNDKVLHDEFVDKLTEALKKIEVSDKDAVGITDYLDKIPKGSIIALQQEFHSHLSLACRVYQEVDKIKFTGKEKEMQDAHKDAMLEVNQLIMKAYAEALKSAFKEDGSLDMAKVNKSLDTARKEITKQAHTILIKKIIENTGVTLKEEDLKKAVDGTSIKHIAERTTASPNDFLHTDTKIGLATWIAGSENTAHQRLVGTKFGDRQIITHFIDDSDHIYAGKKQRIQIRTPSPVVKEGLKKDEYIADVATKLAHIKDHYDLVNRASGDNLGRPKAYIYNSYTAFNDYNDDLTTKNFQTKSAIHILHGAHQFNASQLKDKDAVFCFVQNISVNGFGDTLGYDKKNELKIESTLMTEMALLHTLYETESDKTKINAVFALYKSFLNTPYINKQFFSLSSQGQEAIKAIQNLKEEWKKPDAVVAVQDKSILALRNLMAHNLHFTHEYSKLFQALSVYVEQASIGGCKSGNERAQAINGRVAILDSVLNEHSRPLSTEEETILTQLDNLAKGTDIPKAAEELKNALDFVYNEKGLQTALSNISNFDQGAPAKVEAKNGNPGPTSRNRAEELESVMTNLHQDKAGSMQAHKGLTKAMLSAWKEFPDKSKKDAKGVYKASHPSVVYESDLTKKIGIYRGGADVNKDFVTAKLTSDEAISALYKGVEKYQKRHQQQIAGYEKHNDKDITNSNDPFYFRKALVALIETANLAKYGGDEASREKYPVTAAIKLEHFLGKDGAALYKLALEEEMNSKEYRDAVFKASTAHYPGEKWAERPVIIVAGPSGCGKSFAAEAAVQRAGEEFLPKVSGNGEGNDVLSVDGGVGREVSQMRKLLTQAANNRGFSGVKDLHNKSKALGNIKNIIQEVGFATPSMGVVIPETFSNPFLIIKLMFKSKSSKTKMIFTRIDGDDPTVFKKVVAFMGSSRAWKRDNFKEEALDLNKEKVVESKGYGHAGFKPGKVGSLIAEGWFKFFHPFSKDQRCMEIVNDLRIMKKNPMDDKEWIPAEQGEEGAKLISKLVYDVWCTFNKDTREPLDTYHKKNAQTIIKTSGTSIDLNQLKEPLKALKEFNKLLTKNADQFKWIKEMEVPVHVYNLAFQGKVKSQSQTMMTQFKKLSVQCGMIVDQLKANQKLLEGLITGDGDKAVTKELGKVKQHLKFYQQAQMNISGDDGIIKAIEQGKEGKKNFIYKTDQMAYKVCLRSEIPDLDKVAIPDSVTIAIHEEASKIRNFVIDEIPDGKVVVYDVQHNSKTIRTLGRFTEEHIKPSSADTSMQQVDSPAVRFEVLQFPTVEKPSREVSQELILAKVNFSMAMAVQILASMDKCPTKEKPIKLTGENEEELRYLWTALLVLGEKNSKMKFGMDAISVNSSCFSPESEKGTFKFNNNSLYKQVFKNPVFQNPIKQKIEDLEIMFMAKYKHVDIEEKVATAVNTATAMFKNKLHAITDNNVDKEKENEKYKDDAKSVHVEEEDDSDGDGEEVQQSL